MLADASTLCVLLSELAQKNRAEREAKRVLHEAGVAKKKDIVAQSFAIKAERQVIHRETYLSICTQLLFVGTSE